MLQDLLGTQLDLPVRVAIAAIVIAVLLGLTVLIVRRLSGGGAGPGSRSRQARLAVLDSVPVDQRRRLVLVRRDEVEHLLLVGGPSDLVVEPGIPRGGRDAAQVRDGREPTALREPTQREALPRRPAGPALASEPAAGRLASPAKPDLLARPDPVKPAIPAPLDEPVKPEAAPLSFESKQGIEPEPAPAPAERRPFSFRRPEGEAPAPRSFSRPTPAAERPARPAPAFTSMRLPSAKPTVRTLETEAKTEDAPPAELPATVALAETHAAAPEDTAPPRDEAAPALHDAAPAVEPVKDEAPAEHISPTEEPSAPQETAVEEAAPAEAVVVETVVVETVVVEPVAEPVAAEAFDTPEASPLPETPAIVEPSPASRRRPWKPPGSIHRCSR